MTDHLYNDYIIYDNNIRNIKKIIIIIIQKSKMLKIVSSDAK